MSPRPADPALTSCDASCHPAYLSPKAHTKLSHPQAFSGLRIHTDELSEVIQRFAPATLTMAIVSLEPPFLLPSAPAQQVDLMGFV